MSAELFKLNEATRKYECTPEGVSEAIAKLGAKGADLNQAVANCTQEMQTRSSKIDPKAFQESMLGRNLDSFGERFLRLPPQVAKNLPSLQNIPPSSTSPNSGQRPSTTPDIQGGNTARTGTSSTIESTGKRPDLGKTDSGRIENPLAQKPTTQQPVDYAKNAMDRAGGMLGNARDQMRGATDKRMKDAGL